MSAKDNITILIAPLDWGLGHATRCIPIINHLLKLHCNVVIATDGKQHNLLKTEFPQLRFVHLPGYNIRYSNKKRFFNLKIIFQLPKLINAIRKEKKWLQQFLLNNKINAVISDNRYGLFHISVQSIFITHQLTIKAGFPFIEKMLQKLNYRHINHFSACWVPDQCGKTNLAGKLSHPAILPAITVNYIGIISRFQLLNPTIKRYRLLIVLSGPEPQRTLLEKMLLQQLEKTEQPVLFIRGLPGNEAHLSNQKHITFHNHLPASQLEQAFQQSEYVISRCGYTTVMDICKLKIKSILIPTSGQTEQEYLAEHLQKQGFCLSANQEGFNLINELEKAEKFEYEFPDFDMENYKTVLDEFVETLRSK